MPETPIEHLHLPERPYRALLKAGVDTVEQLCRLTPERLTVIPGCWVKSLKAVENALASRGLHLSKSPRP